MPTPLLSGEQEYVDDSVDLRRRIGILEEQLRLSKQEASQAKGEAYSVRIAVTELRKILDPLHNFMRVLYGELDVFPVDELSPVNAPVVTDAKKAVWDIWKNKLGGQCARIIDALLVHGTMTRTQLCIATGIQGSNIAKPISRLYTANLLNKDGSSYSLKTI